MAPEPDSTSSDGTPPRGARGRRWRSFGLVLIGLAAASALALALLPHREPVVAEEPAVMRSSDRHAEPDRRLAKIATGLGLPTDPIPDARLAIDKSDLTLQFYSGRILLKTYPVARGFGDIEDKIRRDDGRTPEGEFSLCEHVVQADPHGWRDVWLQIGYPNREDAERGLRDGIITRAQYRAILDAAARGDEPPDDTDLGSGVGIHIGGINPPNWTQGCLAMQREHGVEVARNVAVGTPVRIQR